MFIPVGLLGRAFQTMRDEALEADMLAIGRREDRRRAWTAYQDAAAELEEACTGPTASLLYLGDHGWDGFTLDGQPIARPQRSVPPPAPGAYRTAADALGPGPHGFFAVPAGRHSVRVREGGREIATSLVVYAADAVLLSVDVAAGAWVGVAPSDAPAILDRYGAGELGLLDYGTWIAQPRLADGRARRSADVLAVVHGLATQALEAAQGGRHDEAAHHAWSAGALLDGVPLPSLEPITTAFGFQVFDLAGKGDLAAARAVLDVALTLLPGDATMLAVGGELCVREGKRDDARAMLSTAVGRPSGLDANWRLRAASALAALD